MLGAGVLGVALYFAEMGAFDRQIINAYAAALYSASELM